MNSSNPKRQALILHGLERASNEIGDITAPVLDAFFKLYPNCKSRFVELAFERVESLQARMVETTLYVLMHYFERPAEMVVLLWDTVPHHQDTLRVLPVWYSGLIHSTIDVIVQTVPVGATEELATWDLLRTELSELVTKFSRQPFRPVEEDANQVVSCGAPGRV